MEIAPMIITRILRDKSVTLSQLEAKAVERNISLNDLYAALDKVHRDKRIQRKVLKGEIHYFKTVTKTPNDYLRWVRENYPIMDESNNANHPAFDDLNYSYLFLSPEEMKVYKTNLTGGFKKGQSLFHN